MQGCLVGAAGERVCPLGAIGVAGDSALFRGNKGPGQTGSNGNAGPIDALGRPVAQAEAAYFRQLENYQRQIERQQEADRRNALVG